MIYQDETEREYITTPEAAKLAGLSTNYIALLARTEKLDGFRIGQAREWFVYRDSLETFLSTNRKPGPKGSRQKKPAETP